LAACARISPTQSRCATFACLGGGVGVPQLASATSAPISAAISASREAV
jgi:hypothetical protein